MAKFYLIIGIPGSGKTTKANEIIKNHPNTLHYETDMFFINSNGEYIFNPSMLGIANNWCKTKTEEAMRKGLDVIVSNTSLTPRERRPYLALIKKYNYDYEIINCTGNFKNIHGVPENKLEIIKNRYIPFSEEEFNNLQ